jgi:hypothetical protein
VKAVSGRGKRREEEEEEEKKSRRGAGGVKGISGALV